MKKFFVLLVLVMFAVTMFADLMQPTGKTAIVRENVKETRLVRETSAQRNVPAHEFVTAPQSLITNYYDYMPGSYNSLPVAVQPDAFGGVYMIFHARETTTVNRREYYAYVDAAGNVTNVGTIGTQDVWEGYGGIDTDPSNGDPIAAWHWTPTGGMFEACASYDLFHFGAPGLWVENWTVIDNTNNWTPDEFIWPYVHIGRSPVAGKHRVYIQGNNATSAVGGDPSENVLLAYADFNEMDFNMQSQLDWTFITLPIFDNWHNETPNWNRPSHGMCADEMSGRVAFFGYNQAAEAEGNDYEEFYVYYNDNYGEGDWTYVATECRFDTGNPNDMFWNELDNIPHSLYWGPVNSGHNSAIFSDGASKINMSINMGLQTYEDSEDASYYYPWEIFPYSVQFDFNTGEFVLQAQDSFVDEEAANQDYVHGPNDLFVPWDTDNDGVLDYVDEEDNVYMYNGWPIWHYDTDTAFHENYMHMTTNEENGWLVNVWSDGLNNRYYNDSGDEDYVEWATVPELYITASNDNGANWSDPIIMNAKVGDDNYVPEFEGMIPCYIYPGNKIQDLGNNFGLLHLMFYDDNSFGSFVQGFGENIGGTMMYASIKIDFTQTNQGPVSSDNPEIVTESVLNNYPNPFMGSTTISFSIGETVTDGSIEIFNMKGQKVKEFSIDGKDSVVWDATSQASGVYLYKMKANGRYTSTKKMILLK